MIMSYIDAINEKFNEIEKEIKELKRFQDITHEQYKAKKTPHKCPVCEGCGNDKGIRKDHPNFEFFYTYSPCNACEGKGIVWG